MKKILLLLPLVTPLLSGQMLVTAPELTALQAAIDANIANMATGIASTVTATESLARTAQEAVDTAQELATLPQSMMKGYIDEQQRNWRRMVQAYDQFKAVGNDLVDYSFLEWDKIPPNHEATLKKGLMQTRTKFTAGLKDLIDTTQVLYEEAANWIDTVGSTSGYEIPLIDGQVSDIGFLQNISESLRVQLELLEQQTQLLLALVRDRHEQRGREEIELAQESNLQFVDTDMLVDFFTPTGTLSEDLLNPWDDTNITTEPWYINYNGGN